jgi:CheY-like chemotaxis protein
MTSGCADSRRPRITAKTAGNAVIEDALFETRRSIERSETVAGPSGPRRLPGMVVQMIGVGEATGALDTMLAKIAEFYEGSGHRCGPACSRCSSRSRSRSSASSSAASWSPCTADLRPHQPAHLTARCRRSGAAVETGRRPPGAATLLAVFALALALVGSGLWPLSRATVALAGLFAVALIDAATVRFADRFAITADLHFALDAALISAYVHATGGVASVFTPLYALPVVASAGVQYRRGSVRAATLASLCFIGIVCSQYWWPDTASVLEGLPTADVAWSRWASTSSRSTPWLPGHQLAENLRWADVAMEAASEKIADLEAFNRNVIDHLANGLTTMDANGRVMTYNRAAAVITGWDGDVTSQPATEVLQLPASFSTALASDREAGRARPSTTPISADGRPIELGVAPRRCRSGPGSAASFSPSRTSPTSRALERTAQLRQRLAAVVNGRQIAHEIRNPLASMSGAIQVLRGELPLSTEQAQLMDIVLRESDRLNGDPVLPHLCQAEPGGGGPHRRRAARRGGHREAAAHEPRTLHAPSRGADRARRARLARRRREPAQTDHVEPGDQRPQGDAEGRPDGALRGGGRHLRLDRRARRGHGHPGGAGGLDLRSVPRLVRTRHRPRARHRPPHRDRLQWAHRCRVHGGTRHDHHRAIPGAERRRVTRRLATDIRYGHAAAQKPRILVVDDERFREMLSIVLGREGYEVFTAEDVTSALEQIRRGPAPDLLISDLRMPDGSGVDVLRALKERSPGSVGLLLTAYASADTAVEALRLGADDYLTKPFDVADLKQRVARYLEAKRLAENRSRPRAAGRGFVLAGLAARSSTSSVWWRGSRAPTRACSSPANPAPARSGRRARSTSSRRARCSRSWPATAALSPSPFWSPNSSAI